MDKILSGVGIVVGGLQGGRGRQAAREKFHGNDNSRRLPRAVELTALVAATEPPFSMNAPRGGKRSLALGKLTRVKGWLCTVSNTYPTPSHSLQPQPLQLYVWVSVGSGGVDAEAVFVSGVLCLWYSGLELLWVSLHFSRCILVWERQGEMGSGGDGERMRVDLEGDGLQSKNIQDENDDLYTELWLGCAGPLVNILRAGQKVVYFPQGHIEQVLLSRPSTFLRSIFEGTYPLIYNGESLGDKQKESFQKLEQFPEKVEAYTNQDGQMEMPIYNLPSKIFCKVVYVQLKAEACTDEVFAQVTLLPEAKQEWRSPDHGNSQFFPRRTHSYSFSKTLTPSDTNTHGGFSVPKRHADECLPPLDMTQQPPVQELIAKDLHGTEWRFRHIFRGQPKRHLLTSGWSQFVTSKKLVAGDACIFLRGANGELRVGVRRATRLQNNVSASVLSGHSMQHGILASAFHAISTGTMFTVYFRPWTSPEFIIPYDQYIKSAENNYSVGTRFRMLFEGEECSQQRCAGTIVGIEDVDAIRWPNSEWRRFKVQWDTSDVTPCPERVAAWNIEPIEFIKKKHTSILPQLKRARPTDPLCPAIPILVGDVEHTKIQSGVLQGQENDDIGAHKPDTSKLPSLLVVPPPNSDWGPQHFPMHDPFYQCPGKTILFQGENPLSSGIANGCSLTFTYCGACDNVGGSRNLSFANLDSSNCEFQDWRALEPKGNEASFAQQNRIDKYKLFGVNLINSPAELPSPQVASSSELQSPCSIPPTSQSSISESIQASEPSKSVSGDISDKQCKNCCSSWSGAAQRLGGLFLFITIDGLFANGKANLKTYIRVLFQVLKYGTALGRSIDLARFDGYDELIIELDQMFDFGGSLMDGSCRWHVTYTDDEGDMMLLGDYPWQEFRSMVQRIFICPKEETERLNSATPS
ncbi:Auxin response factor 4 [Vitis vinifera]|uniref:Auxin response factor n=1 Tax=Vitis vinifera TaxID=29760 RepID=A0A438KI64_VITVI|nr:Auxin response factor 4 [Vitis vinifera]